jgi:hypothetical protein
MQTKLTLRLDSDLIERAKIYSAQRGKSVSQIVADYFALLDETAPARIAEVTPLVAALKGCLRGSSKGS